MAAQNVFFPAVVFEREIYDSGQSEGHRCHTRAPFITGCLEINGGILMDTLKRLSSGRSIFLSVGKAVERLSEPYAGCWCQLSLFFYYQWGLDYMSAGVQCLQSCSVSHFLG